FQALQDKITAELRARDGDVYREERWDRPGGGGGITRTFSGGIVLEKGGVNSSEVVGELSEGFARTLPRGEGTAFYATGISLVLHPAHPFVPAVHANYRYIERGSQAWFGGGADLTPYYPFEEDVRHFHQTYYDALAPWGEQWY